MNESGEVVALNSFRQEIGGYHYSTEEMHQHPHPPTGYNPQYRQSYSGSFVTSSPYRGGNHRRALSNPSDRGIELENSYGTTLITHGLDQVRPTKKSVNPFIMAEKRQHQQQHHVYHNPLVYGNNVFEEYSPSEDVFDGGEEEDILSETLGNMRLGSGSGESGYHGTFQDTTNPNSPLSSSASTHPRTPMKHAPGMYSHQRTPSNLSNASSVSFGLNDSYGGDPGIPMISTPLKFVPYTLNPVNITHE